MSYSLRTVRLLLIFSLVLLVLYFCAGVLIPLAFGVVLAMLLMPVSRWLERKGLNRAIASLISLLLLVLLAAGLVWLVAWQMEDLIKDFSKIQQQLDKLFQQVKEFVSHHLGINQQQQKQIMADQQASGMQQVANVAMFTLSTVLGLTVNLILVVVYVFLFLYSRSHFKIFVLRLIDAQYKGTAEKIMVSASQVTQQYLTGLAMMIVLLWVMYGIGFSIVGIKNAIFFAILCGLLEIVPFAGNITGTSITVLIALAQGGGANVVLGVLITYGIVQFTQTYILEPLVVGNQVNINPLFTILVIVAGEALWGIAGMVLAIPLLGMFKVICDHIEPLKPYGYLIGSQSGKADKRLFKNWSKSKES